MRKKSKTCCKNHLILTLEGIPLLTEKSVKLKTNTLNQHADWSMNSNMAQKYIHYFGNESLNDYFEAYGIVTKNNVSIDTLNPKICPNCNEGNTVDSKFCTSVK